MFVELKLVYRTVMLFADWDGSSHIEKSVFF